MITKIVREPAAPQNSFECALRQRLRVKVPSNSEERTLKTVLSLKTHPIAIGAPTHTNGHVAALILSIKQH